MPRGACVDSLGHVENGRYDAAIVGASIAGCAAATMLGRRGARVALIESHRDPAKYKTTCTHFIQPSATPTLERLGLVEPIEAAGGIRNGLEIWTRFGWVRPRPGDDHPVPAYGYSIRRERLDPMLRTLAAETEGVELMLGATAKEVLWSDGRPAGLRVERADGGSDEIRAKMIIAADGRNSGMAVLTGVRGRVLPNNRFMYFAYYRDLDLICGTRSQFWFLDPDVAYAFPNDDGLTVMALVATKDKLPAFKRDIEESFLRYFDDLPLAPDVRGAERVSPMLGKLDMPNVYRPVAKPGIAFVGDAAMAADPLWGVGCGWALQSAEWLVEETAGALTGGGDLDASLERYRKRHFRSLVTHYLMTSDYSSGRRLNPLERFIFRAASRDHRTALTFHDIGTRSVPPQKMFSPSVLGRAIWAALRGQDDSGPEVEEVARSNGRPAAVA